MSDVRDRIDDLEKFVERTEGKVYRRRTFFSMCAILGIAPTMAKLSPAMADAKELVLVNWGGDAIKGMKAAWVDAYLKKYPDRKVAIDGTGPATGRIKLMVESKKVTWDVMDRNLHTALELGPQGMLEPIDYSVVDKSKVRPEHAVEWGIGNYIYAMVLTYNTKKWGGMLPENWKDVWDFQKFPGKRAFRREPDATLEAALMAAGVPKDKIYPIDMKLALDMHKKMKEHAIYYDVIADGQNAYRNGEAHLGVLLNTRAWPLKQDTKGLVDWTWNEGISWGACWMIPKGASGGRAISDFINVTLEPEGQAQLLKTNGYGPSNPEAAKLLDAEWNKVNPGAPENYAKMLPGGIAWYAKNATDARQQLLDVLAG
jgi:putative spermidine/putrescine transport system substrate-binding protein